MKTDHKFSPRGPKESTILAAIENASEILCDALNVSVTLRVERMNGWGHSDAYHAGKWCPSKNMVKINMRNLYGASLEQIIEVLGHEYRHAVQTLHGKCDDITDMNLEHGKGHYGNTYYNMPVEKDARKYQKAYASLVFNSPDFRFKSEMAIIVDGEPIKIPDFDASYALIGRPRERLMRFQEVKKGPQFWFDIADINGAKKWTRSVFNKVWKEHRQQLMSQPFEIVYRAATIDDLVC